MQITTTCVMNVFVFVLLVLLCDGDVTMPDEDLWDRNIALLITVAGSFWQCADPFFDFCLQCFWSGTKFLDVRTLHLLYAKWCHRMCNVERWTLTHSSWTLFLLELNWNSNCFQQPMQRTQLVSSFEFYAEMYNEWFTAATALLLTSCAVMMSRESFCPSLNRVKLTFQVQPFSLLLLLTAGIHFLSATHMTNYVQQQHPWITAHTHTHTHTERMYMSVMTERT